MNPKTQTTDAPVGTAPKPEWIRLPAPSHRCPYTGLSRSTLNELTIPGPANGNKPPLKSVVLRKRGAVRGIRLITIWRMTKDGMLNPVEILPGTLRYRLNEITRLAQAGTAPESLPRGSRGIGAVASAA